MDWRGSSNIPEPIAADSLVPGNLGQQTNAGLWTTTNAVPNDAGTLETEGLRETLMYHGPVHRSRTRSATILWIAAILLLAARPAAADNRRFVVAESVHVGPGETLDTVACLACSIQVDGVVEDSAFLIFGELQNRGTIEGDAIVIAGSLENAGPIGGDATVVAGTMRLREDVSGDAVTVLGNIEVEGPDVNIGGDAVTVIGRLTGSFPSSVGGVIEQVGGDRVGRLALSGMIGAILLLALASVVVLLTLNLLGYFILGTKRLATMADTLVGNAAVCFLLGLGTCFALVVIGLIVAMLLPVSLPIVLLLVLVSVVGYSGLTFGVGRNLFSHLKPLTASLLAALVVIVIQMIPIVGWLALPLIWNIAIGAAVLSGFGTGTNWLTARAQGGSSEHQAGS